MDATLADGYVVDEIISSIDRHVDGTVLKIMEPTPLLSSLVAAHTEHSAVVISARASGSRILARIVSRTCCSRPFELVPHHRSPEP